MKKITAFLMVIILMMGLAACGSQGTDAQDDDGAVNDAPQGDTANGDNQSGAEEPQQEPEESPDADGSQESGGVLVVYFSATGNTQTAAEYIAQATGGDLFQLEPVEPYTSDDLNWRDDSSRVSYGHENPDDRYVELTADTVDNWDDYDTVFIGYPIWWGIAAWPVDTFVEANDFTGKTVIPFCTSSSSGLGDSGDLLAQLAGTGDWQEGHRFRSSVSEEDVADWLAELGI